MDKIRTDRVAVVEGRYDAARLAGILDTTILTTDGFGIYTDRNKQNLLKTLARKRGLLLLTDSDAAGFRIRTYLTNLAGAQYVAQAYVPAVPGKERRKAQPGKEGLLGVEGIDDGTLRAVLQAALAGETEAPPGKKAGRAITYTDLYDWGVSGTADSAARRMALLKALGLPPRLSKKALVEVLNTLYSFEELDERIRQAEKAREDAGEHPQNPGAEEG